MDDERLIDQYTAAFVEFALSGEQALWNSTSGDGLDDHADESAYAVTEIVTGWW